MVILECWWNEENVQLKHNTLHEKSGHELDSWPFCFLNQQWNNCANTHAFCFNSILLHLMPYFIRMTLVFNILIRINHILFYQIKLTDVFNKKWGYNTFRMRQRPNEASEFVRTPQRYNLWWDRSFRIKNKLEHPLVQSSCLKKNQNDWLLWLLKYDSANNSFGIILLVVQIEWDLVAKDEFLSFRH